MPASRLQFPLAGAAILALLLIGLASDGTARTVGVVLVAAAYLAANIYFERRAKRLRRERNSASASERHA